MLLKMLLYSNVKNKKQVREYNISGAHKPFAFILWAIHGILPYPIGVNGMLKMMS
jgi:hypothetical protein